MQLEQKFFNTVKGTSTIATYCQTLRNIADWLDDVDAPVTESQLVLQTLRGLPEDLGNQASFLQFQKPPPTFMETRSALLLLEGQRRAQIPAGEQGTALAAHGGGGSRGPGIGGNGGQHFGHTSGGSGQPYGYGGRGQSHGGCGGRPTRGRGRGRNSGAYPRQSGQYPPWQITYHTNPSQQWAGLLGPRPTPSQQVAQAYYTQPTNSFFPNSPQTQPYYPPPSQPTPHTLYPHTPYLSPSTPPTPTALAHQFDTMTLREPTWLMDTGASHHIVSDPGSSDGQRDSSLQ